MATATVLAVACGDASEPARDDAERQPPAPDDVGETPAAESQGGRGAAEAENDTDDESNDPVATPDGTLNGAPSADDAEPATPEPSSDVPSPDNPIIVPLGAIGGLPPVEACDASHLSVSQCLVALETGTCNAAVALRTRLPSSAMLPFGIPRPERMR